MTTATKTIKSVTPVQRRQVKGGGFKLVTSGGQGLWDVRIRYTDGTERLVIGEFKYTLAQAQTCINNRGWEVDELKRQQEKE